MANFGYEQVAPKEKTKKVEKVFSSVAGNYDLMNDLMSFGIHRFWKLYATHIINLGTKSRILDLAGGTGDIAFAMYPKIAATATITVCDINIAMLHQGWQKRINLGITKRVDFVQGSAESLPFNKNTFDLITIAFGLRNITDQKTALASIYDKLTYGGELLILEFSKVQSSLIDKIYNLYSFKFIPWLGKNIAKDEASYRYLVESIRTHSDQESLAAMMEQAGFQKITYLNLANGIVAIHRGYKL